VSLLAIDMGSSSCKAVAFSVDGTILAQSNYSYMPDPRPPWVEMQPQKFWDALCSVSHAIAREVSEDPVEAMAISSHGETFVPVDRLNQPLAPAILNMDNRALAETEWIAQAVGRRRIFEITGLAAHPMYPIPKILWLRQHQAELFSATARFLSVPDFLLTRLGLPAYIDYSSAGRFLAFDVRRQRWSEDILSACDLSADRLATPVPAGTFVGKLSATAATDLGLPMGVAVVVGGHDQPCGALGSGVVDRGRVSASLGTYECLLAASEAPFLNDEAYQANLNSYSHVVPERYVTLAYFPSGIMLDWFLHLLYAERLNADTASIGELCAELEEHAPAGPTGLSIAPHLLGTCNPDFNPRASGVIVGLRPATNASQIYKGILEGIGCELAGMAELLQRVTGPFRDLYVTGGGCRSRLGLKLRAAMSGCRLHLMRSPEAVCLGTAILAGTGTGKYRDISEAISTIVQVADTVQPDAELGESYRTLRQQYRLLYSSLAAMRRAPDASAAQGGQT
jgi:xylulokinase